MKAVTRADLDALSAKARSSPRLRAHLNLHAELSDPVQRLAVAVEPGSYFRAHRHPHTWELLQALRGSFVLLYFDAAGVVTTRTLLGPETPVVEYPAGTWHTLAALDPGSVFFEVKHGPYIPPPPADLAAWAPAEGSSEVKSFLDWIARATVGERAPHLQSSTGGVP
jgi:cupin fold WbuC family metalloprotein